MQWGSSSTCTRSSSMPERRRHFFCIMFVHHTPAIVLLLLILQLSCQIYQLLIVNNVKRTRKKKRDLFTHTHTHTHTEGHNLHSFTTFPFFNRHHLYNATPSFNHKLIKHFSSNNSRLLFVVITNLRPP